MIAVDGAPARIRIESHHGAAALAALVPEWRALCRGARVSPFSRPEWLVPWARHLPDGELLTLALRGDDRLLGLVPLSHRDDGLHLAGGDVTDYRDAIVDPTLPLDALAEALGTTLERRQAPALHLRGLRPGSPLLAMPAPYGWHDARALDETCPYVPLPDAVAALDDQVAAHVARDVARARRRLADRAVRVVSAGEAAADPLLDALVRLHGAQWQARGQPGVLADARVQAFHRDVVRGFVGDGLELHAITVDGAAIAVIYGLCDARRAYYYLSAFDPAWAAVSPGTLVVYTAMERAIAHGRQTFDFLRGAEPYKYRWGARDAFTERRSWTR